MTDDKNDEELEQTKRIMERLVRTPPKPHKDKAGSKRPAKTDRPRRPEKPAKG